METQLSDLTEEGEYCCAVKATNRQALVDYIKAFTYPSGKNTPILSIALGGKDLGHAESSVKYTTEADISHQSVPCPCGNPKHWLIKYDEELV
jgi:hypothetical protein